ncbi:hypothetical protein SAMN04487783_2433 [Agrococcus baldri]|uniref:Uncharacterized protein n=1 Tax=Agrococcus baldri TaxID=153730 RepID=A0AA94HP29_9MICO|nr:hypothetical protein [Agrococcus baldri]SFS17861.1 hypothetical protein SAMN04487783_2433 [Agrococcus baldri]
MLMNRSARTGAAAAVLVAGLLVSGCGLLPSPSMPPVPTAEPAPSGSAEPGTQAQQCAQLVAEVSSIATDLGQIGSRLGTDPLGALALLGGITERIGDLETRVTDPALLGRIGEIQAGWDALVADATESISAGDTSAFERIGSGLTELGEQVTALQEFCAGTA